MGIRNLIKLQQMGRLKHISYNSLISIQSSIMSNTEEQGNKKQDNSQNVFKIQIKQKNSTIKKRRVKSWSNQEDQLLIKLYNQFPKKWGLISSKMKDRNQNQCLHRYRRLSQFGFQKKIWSAEQDQTIMNMVKKIGKNWKALSQMLGTKSGKQIRQRFINKLDPKIKTEDWTEEEDKLILKYYSEYGSKWSEISKIIPGRPQNKIKNRFYSFIQKNYDIKFVKLQSEDEKRNFEETNQPKKFPKRRYLKQIACNIKNPKLSKKSAADVENNGNDEQKEEPSIREVEQYDQQMNNMEKFELMNSNVLFSQNYGLQSLIRVEEQLHQVLENRNRSNRSLVSHNELENEHDLLYLSQR